MSLHSALRKALVLAGTALMLGACSTVPLSTINAMHAFDMSTVDPAALRLAMRVPNTLPLGAGVEAELTINVGVNDRAPQTLTYRMTELTSAAELAAMSAHARSGETIHVFALDARSAGELAAYLDELRRTAEPGSRSLSLGLGFSGCDVASSVSSVPFTTFIRLGAGEPYLVLTRERDAIALASGANDPGTELCN